MSASHPCVTLPSVQKVAYSISWQGLSPFFVQDLSKPRSLSDASSASDAGALPLQARPHRQLGSPVSLDTGTYEGLGQPPASLTQFYELRIETKGAKPTLAHEAYPIQVELFAPEPRLAYRQWNTPQYLVKVSTMRHIAVGPNLRSCCGWRCQRFSILTRQG